MKHTKITVATFGLVLGALLLSSCEDIHSPIFYYINQEVPIEEYGITGDISGIVKQGDYIFVNSGHIYKKKAEQSADTGKYNKQWVRAGNEPGFMYGLGSDGTNLYSLCVTYSENVDTGRNSVKNGVLYYSANNGESWTKVDSTGILSIVQDKSGNKAYARKSDGLHELSASGEGSILSGSDENSKSVSNGKPYPGPSVYSGSMYYYTDDTSTTLYYSSTGSDGTKVSLDLGKIKSLEVTADYLLIGTEHVKSGTSYKGGGIYKIALNAGTPASSTTTFTNNAQSIMSTAYTVTHIFALDQTKNESSTDIYTGVNITGAFNSSSHASFPNIGLYAYYPSRGTWNRDGTNDDTTTPKGN